MNGWRQRTPEEIQQRAARLMGGPLTTHIIGQWVSADAGRELSEVTLFEDSTVQVAGGAQLEFLVTIVQAAWHNHLRGRIA